MTKKEMIVRIEKIASLSLSLTHSNTPSQKNKYQPMRWNYNTFIYTVEKIGHLWGILPEIKRNLTFFAHFVCPKECVFESIKKILEIFSSSQQPKVNYEH